MEKLNNIIKSNKKSSLKHIVNDIKNNISIEELYNDVINKAEFNNNYNKILLERNNEYEIFMLCWSKNAITAFHEHPKNGCILILLNGVLIEYISDKNNKINHEKDIKYKNFFKKGSVGYIDNNIGVHKIISKEKSITLHIYSPPNFIFSAL